jgi:hypothetical protein
MSNFSRCEFRLESITRMQLADVSIQDEPSLGDLGIMDYAKITSAMATGVLPFSFDLNVQARNPNTGTAAMNKLDWILLIDGIEMSRGILNQRVEIPSSGITTFPVSMNFDLFKALSGKSGDALLNFAFNLSGSGDRPTRVTLKAKPTIYVGSRAIDYPGYISIRQDFKSQ